MRNQTLKNASAILDALGSGQLTKDELQARLVAAGIRPTKDSLNNLLADLVELEWIEKIGANYRVGLSLALVYKRALDAEKRAARAIMKRLEFLTGDVEAQC